MITRLSNYPYAQIENIMPLEQYEDVSLCWKVRLLHSAHKRFFKVLNSLGVRGVGLLANSLKKIIKFPPANGPVIVRIGDDLLIRVDPSFDKGLETSIYETGSYESGTLYLIRQLLRPGDYFVDIGANIGLMSITASKIVGSDGMVFSCEPVPSTYAILNYNVVINYLKNIETYNLALGSTKEERLIYENTDYNRGGATLVEDEASEKGMNIFVDTLDNILPDDKKRKVRLMKIDVEGWELEVLLGGENLLRSKRAPMVIMEYDNDSEKSKSALRYLQSVNDYEIYILEKGKELISPLVKINDRKNLPAHDNIVFVLPSHRKTFSDNLSVKG